MTSFQQGTQQTYEYHAVDNFEIRVENRSSGCWSSSSVKLVQLCCIGILFPTVWILVPAYARLLSYSNSTVSLAFEQVYMIDSKYSTFWCQGHLLYTNTTFDAYLMEEEPTVFLQAQKLTRNFELNDDLKEYWGTYLPKGSELTIKSCARHLGATITLVQANPSGLFMCLNKASSSEEGISDVNNNVSSKETVVHHVNSRHLTNNDQVSHNPSLVLGKNITKLDYSERKILNKSSSNFYEEVDDIENGAFEEIDLSIERGVSPIRSALDDTSLSEEGLTSSSEEDLLNCSVVLITKPVFPDENCINAISSKYSLVHYVVDEAGYYSIIFSSAFEQKGKENNPVFAEISLQKSTYNTTTAISNCHNTTECQFALRFASSERIVVALSGPQTEDLDLNNSIFPVESECIPRTPIYLAFGLTLPIALILCAFL